MTDGIQRAAREIADTVVRPLQAKLAASEALLDGMTTEAKRHAARVGQLEAELARAHAHHMFGVDVDGPPADRVGALYYLRNHGLPEATPADLDTACEGLVTPWVSGPGPED